MLSRTVVAVTAVTILLGSPALVAEDPIAFQDLRVQLGLEKHLKGWAFGHGAAWGDVDNDGRPDLYVGAFAGRDMYGEPNAPLPNMLFLNTAEGFRLDGQQAIQLRGRRDRTTSVLFVDLDNDGDLELVLANHYREISADGSLLFENLGGGKFQDVTAAAGQWPHKLGPRNVAGVDMNADGLLDLVFADGTYGGKPDRHVVVLENQGKLKFTDASAKYGLSTGRNHDLGLAVGDVNNDGVFDFFVAGCNRLFVSGPGRKYRQVQPDTFVRPRGRDAFACGADFGDLNGDGLLDLVTTVHGQPSRIHVYLNKGMRDGEPRYEQVTEAAGVADDFASKGITGLPVKNAFVALQDVDNDGRVDIMLAVVYRAKDGTVQPVVLRNLGSSGGVPRFSRPPNKSLVGYYAPTPVADFDLDGRVDIFMCTWFSELPSYLFRNVSKGGHWLTVKVEGRGKGLNPMGVGSVVWVYKAGALGDRKSLIARYDMAIGTGYSCGEEALAHVGLGDAKLVDVEVTWDGRSVKKTNVAADQMIAIPFEAK